jgi:hypothetical protein
LGIPAREAETECWAWKGSLMGRVAAFAFVRNEADDIGWWISHHLAAGISTLIIYDDFSSDGTWAVLQAAQLTGRVHPLRADAGLPQAERRDAAIRDALARYGQTADWIGILEIDEFVVFDDERAALGNVFDGLGDADAMAFSWCVFGSGSNVRRPRVSPLQAYDRHARADFFLHERASLFYRTRAIDTAAVGTPFWGTPSERITMSYGSPAVIHEGARIQPNWHGARVRKYACRSMAHFLDRTRGLPQDGLADWWRTHDRNEDAIHVPGNAGAAAPFVHRLYRELWSRTILRAQLAGVLNAVSGDSGLVDRGEAAEAFTIHSSESGVIVYDVAQHALRAIPTETFEAEAPGAAGWESVFAFRCPVIADWVVLVRQGEGAFDQGQIGLMLGLMPLRAVPAGADMIALQLPFNGRYMTAIPFNGQVTFDRQQVQGWEQFTLRPAEATDVVRARVGGIAALARRGLSADGVRSGLTDIAIEQGEALAAVFAMLSGADQQVLIDAFPGCFPIWLRGPDA